MCATITWFLHLSHLFLAISFPFWSEYLNEQKWKIRLHLVEILGAVVLSSLGPVIFVSMSEYIFARFPPFFARPSRDAAFYSVVLPSAVMIAVGLNLTIYSFYQIRKVIDKLQICIMYVYMC